MRKPARPMLMLVAALVLTACAAPPTPAVSRPPAATPMSTPTPGAAPSEAPGTDAAAELDRLPTLLEAIHPDPWHDIGRDEFVGELAAYRDRLPGPLRLGVGCRAHARLGPSEPRRARRAPVRPAGELARGAPGEIPSSLRPSPRRSAEAPPRSNGTGSYTSPRWLARS